MSIVVDQQEDDYIDPNEETFEEEVAEEQEPIEEVSEYEVPEKFKDKGIEDVIKSYTELEKEFGRRNNEIGEQRKLIDQLLDLKSKEEKEPERKPVDFDSLVDDPEKAISEAVSNNPELKALREEFAKQTRDSQQKAFEAKHPDYMDIGQSEDFQKFVKSNPALQDAFSKASNYDYQAADGLLTLYKQFTDVAKKQATESKETKKDQVMKDAAVEKSSSGASKKKMYRRSDLIKMRMHDKDRFDSMADEIRLAYAEGRVK